MFVDCNFLCYRSFFTTGNLSYKGAATGVVYGFLRDMKSLLEEHNPRSLVLAFDHGKGLREQKFPWYKEGRRKKRLDDVELAALDEMRVQVEKLKFEYLPSLGFRNVYFQKGYEADDVIASCTRKLSKGMRGVIVSADHDLYQLLRKNVSLYNPIARTWYTRKSLVKEYGIKPHQWRYVKAIAGCKSDDIPGVDGVAEATAAKFLREELKKTTISYHKIKEWLLTKEYLDNLSLVTLPYEGTGDFVVKKDKMDHSAWHKLTEKLGMPSLQESRGAALPNRPKGFGLKG